MKNKHILQKEQLTMLLWVQMDETKHRNALFQFRL
jgi:hypothetical protein